MIENWICVERNEGKNLAVELFFKPCRLSMCKQGKQKQSLENLFSIQTFPSEQFCERLLIQHLCTVTSEMSFMVSTKSSPSLAQLGLHDN